MSVSVTGGALQPVRVVSSSELIENGGKWRIQGRYALRVYGYPTAQRAVKGGAAAPVYVITQDDIDAGAFVVEQGDGAIPIIDIETVGGNRPVEGNVATPVFLVGGSLS